MFLGERLSIVQRVILSTDLSERERALADLEKQQVGDFESLLEAMDGLPVVIRLLDPPLHEFLPSRLELEHEMLRRVRAGPIDDLQAMSDQVARWEEDNPMLGLRGVRLGLMLKDLYRMQARAATTALTRRIQDGGRPHLEIMIPLVAAAEELIRMREMIEEEIAAATAGSGSSGHPDRDDDRASQSRPHRGRDRRRGRFLLVWHQRFDPDDLRPEPRRRRGPVPEGLPRAGHPQLGPFPDTGPAGVGRLVRVATKEGREANEDLVVGLCGEHGGDPESIYFVHSLGLDYVSCSPPRVEGARLAAAQAALQDDRTDA